jgi:hypothetical protein
MAEERGTPSFLVEYLAGRTSPGDIETYVGWWHDAPLGSPAAKVDLHEYLGMTWSQYVRWAATGELPRE